MRFISKRVSHSLESSVWFTAAIIGLVTLAFVFNIRWNWDSDDATFLGFSQYFDGQLIPFLRMRYETWTSRMAIEAVSFTLVRHVFWWRIGTAISLWICIAVPPLLIAKLGQKRVLLLVISALLVLSIPATVWFDAGFIVTSMVYLWVLSAMILAALPAIYSIQGRRLNPWWYLLIVPAAFFAGFAEIAAALLAALYAAWLGWLFYQRFRSKLASQPQKRATEYLLPALFLAFMLALIIFHLVSPGNAARGQTPNWFGPGGLANLEKAYSSTLRQIFTRGYLIPLAYFIVIAFRNYSRTKWSILTAVAIIPIVGSLWLRDPGVSGTMGTMVNNVFQSGNLLWDPYGPVLIPTFYPTNLLVFGLLTLLLVAAIAATVGAFGWGSKSVIVLTILAAGFATKFIIVNTVGAALDIPFHRTDLFMLYAFAIGALLAAFPGTSPDSILVNQRPR